MKMNMNRLDSVDRGAAFVDAVVQAINAAKVIDLSIFSSMISSFSH